MRPRFRIALGIRAQLLLVLMVFLAIPWLGYEYVRELERFLRDAQETTLAGTAQAVATALHDRPRLFEVKAVPHETLATERGTGVAAGPAATPATPAPPREAAPAVPPSLLPPPPPTTPVTRVAPPVRVAPPPAVRAPAAPAAAAAAASPEIEQILQGLTRTRARIWVVDRELNVLARAGTLKPPPIDEPSTLPRFWQWVERETLHPLYSLVLRQPTEDFSEELAGRVLLPAREVDGALSGILTIDRRPTPDNKAVIVSAAHPVWVGDEVKGAVIAEETTNAVLAERNRAFERLFSIVLAALLIGSLALTLFASRLTHRIRSLRDEAEAAIDAHGRIRGLVAASAAGDEIGDLSRSFSSVLSRLGQYASYQQNMASRLSHELRTPIAVVRSSLDNLSLAGLPEDVRVYIERAQEGLSRLTHILTRMTEATRLEQSLADAGRERFDLARVVAGCVDGYRAAYPRQAIALEWSGGELWMDGAPELIAQMLDKLAANAVEFGDPHALLVVRLVDDGESVRVEVENEGSPLPTDMQGRLFDSMVSVRDAQHAGEAHLGLGLYIVRLVAQFHGGTASARNLEGGKGVIVTIVLPRNG